MIPEYILILQKELNCTAPSSVSGIAHNPSLAFFVLAKIGARNPAEKLVHCSNTKSTF
jgi:hypothetical protein